jgi:ATP-dependent Clp protease ATP-binding subunit ClpA
MRKKFTKNTKEMISLSAEEANRLGSNAISDIHLLLAMLSQPENPVLTLLAETGNSPASLRSALEAALNVGPNETPVTRDSIPLDQSAERAIRNGIKEAWKLDRSDIDNIHILLAMTADETNNVAALLNRAGLSYHFLWRIATAETIN